MDNVNSHNQVDQKNLDIKPTSAVMPVVPMPEMDSKPVAKTVLKQRPSKRKLLIYGVILVGVLGVSGVLTSSFINSRRVQVIENGEGIDSGALVIDSEDKSVGVASESPSGLQVEAKVSSEALGKANVRLGLATDARLPSLIMEDDKEGLWQITVIDSSLQFLQNTELRMKLDSNSLTLSNSLNVDANTTLGNESSDTVTLNGTAISIPNNVNFGGNALFINDSSNSVAVGAASTNGHKLYVAGSLRADGQVSTGAGTAGSPGFTWVGNENTGIFRPAVNVLGVSVGGQEVLRVQQGAVLVLSGSNLEVEGYIRAGRGSSNPAWQVARFTGSLDGSGSASISHGVSSAQTKVLLAHAWYRGGSSEAVPMTVEYVNGSSILISGGIPGRQYRVTIVYSQDSAGW